MNNSQNPPNQPIPPTQLAQAPSQSSRQQPPVDYAAEHRPPAKRIALTAPAGSQHRQFRQTPQPHRHFSAGQQTPRRIVFSSQLSAGGNRTPTAPRGGGGTEGAATPNTAQSQHGHSTGAASSTAPSSMASDTGTAATTAVQVASTDVSIRDSTPSRIDDASGTSGRTAEPRSDDLFEYLRLIPNDRVFDTIFQEASVVQALFNRLTDEAKQFVLRLVYLPHPLRWTPFVLWFGGDTRRTVTLLNQLRAQRIVKLSTTVPTGSTLQSAKSDAGSQAASDLGTGPRVANKLMDARYGLHPVFEATLAEAIHCRKAAKNRILREPSKPPKHSPSVLMLHLHASSKWQELLRWMVNDVVQVQMRAAPAPTPASPAESAVSAVEVDPNKSRPPLVDKCFSVAGPNQGAVRPPCVDVELIFKRMQLVHADHGVRVRTEITSSGFQWLLRDVRSQMNSLVAEFVSMTSRWTTATPNAPSTPNSPEARDCAASIDTVIFIFSLMLTRIGQPCTTKYLTPPQVRFLRVAWDLGLVWMHSPDSGKHFFPTPAMLLLLSQAESKSFTSFVAANWMALPSFGDAIDEHTLAVRRLSLPLGVHVDLYHESLLADLKTLGRSSTDITAPPSVDHDAGIIVESNFRVFAYTASALQISILSHICELRVLSPVIVVASLTRDSVQTAYKGGITAEQVLNYLESHGHPAIVAKSQKTGKPIVPEDVAIQLRMWEGERRRLKLHKACVFEFGKEEDLNVFPRAAARAAMGWMLICSKCPKNPSTTSKEFQDWKTDTLEKMRNSRTSLFDFTTSSAPMLAIHATYKNEMTNFIKDLTIKQRQAAMSGNAAPMNAPPPISRRPANQQ